MIFMIGVWMTDSCSRRERFAKRTAIPPPTQDRTGFGIEVTMLVTARQIRVARSLLG